MRPQIQIDGVTVTVWRHLPRQRATDYEVKHHFSQPGMRGGYFFPRRLGPSGVSLEIKSQQSGLELWTEAEKLEVWPAEPLCVEDISVINTASKCIITKAHASVSTEVTRAPLSETQYQTVQQERLIAAMASRKEELPSGIGGPAIGANCPVCGWQHDAQFTQIAIPGKTAFTLSGLLPDIVACVHKAHEKHFPRLCTKEDKLLRTCGGYGNPCKAFHDLGQREAYRALFDTSRRGFIALRGFRRKESE